jgi:hypothetical protein
VLVRMIMINPLPLNKPLPSALASLAGQSLHKREEGSGVIPIRELHLHAATRSTANFTSSLMSWGYPQLTNQVPDVVVQYFVRAIPNSWSDQPGVRS